MKYFPLIWYGIWRKRGRAILILSQILVAFVLFGLLQGMKSGMDQAIGKLSADLFIVRRSVGFAPLPLAIYSQIQSVPGVKSVSYQAVLPGTYQNPKQQVIAIATEVRSAVATIPGVIVAEEAIAAMERTRAGAVVSNDLARKYGWKTGDHIPLQSPLPRKDGSKEWAFDIVGTFEPGEQSLSSEFMIINFAYFDEARQGQNGAVQMYYLKVDDPKQALAVTQAVDNRFINSSNETRTESIREMVQSQMQSIGDMNYVVRAIVGAVMFALLFSTGAMMMQSTHERTPELAVLKTLGFTDRKVFYLILIEAVILCVASAALGLALAARLIPLAKRFVQIDLVMPQSVMLAGAIMAIALALISAALPAWRGLRLQVAEALAGR